MSEQQYFSIALTTFPIMITVLIGILINDARMNDLNSRIDDLRSEMNRRFDEIKELWRSELHRVEEILDARLKHLEDR
jgi:hypothetical protein